eukprot:CAMPEP_0172571686 /NCGR_PEP_ID=MMETSP1067-20121228/132156_1 /TAXON_ID=265564 ORGANISM="Thalassiosira punctigera, Strain Tpunct2005C2" /NCGR_SAMPLE_ID=MMETSP1067 /ASSEMBLY_ACC=CAM_ASM_000444 /LENGTH=39 /DNA_ID= /DNA_START= /DNA_END= /DNA_ORIENTATION=
MWTVIRRGIGGTALPRRSVALLADVVARRSLSALPPPPP